MKIRKFEPLRDFWRACANPRMVLFLFLFAKGVLEMRKNLMVRRLSFVRLGAEMLERREMLSAGGLPAAPTTLVNVANQSVPKLTILPGATDKVLAQYKVSAVGRSFSELTSMTFMSAGSQYLAQDANGLRLMADMDGNAKNGCETQIAYGQIDWQTKLIIMNVYQWQPAWVQPGSPLKVQLVANFSPYLTGDRVGAGLVKADFCNLRGQPIFGDSVKYSGVLPVLHTLKSNAIYFSQQWQPEVSTAYAGQKGIVLFKFQAWTQSQDKPTLVQNLDFVASQGDLKNGVNYSLWVTKWDQEQGADVTFCLQDGVKPLSGKVSFNLKGKGFVLDSGSQFEVRCDGANTLAKNPSLALSFGSGFKAKELKTGQALKGVAINGGEGQFQILTSQSPLFNFKPATAPGLYVSEIQTGYGWSVSPGAQDLVFDAFSVYTKDTGDSLTQVVVDTAGGNKLDLFDCTNYTLWYDSDGNGVVDTVLAKGGLSIVTVGGELTIDVAFNFQLSLGAGTMTRLEVHADVIDSPPTHGLQASLAGVSAMDVNSQAVDTALANASQPFWTFNGYGGGLG